MKFEDRIEELPEEEDDRKQSLFEWDRAETVSHISKNTEVLNLDQKNRFNSIFNDNFKDDLDFDESP